MTYLLLFFEGIIAFISPCILPMLPIYASYFAGGGGRAGALRNAVCFVLGFTAVFVALGAFAGTLGSLLLAHKTAVNIITGLIVTAFGLGYLGILRLPTPRRAQTAHLDVKKLGLASAILFGAVFAIGWTPCVGAFLGSALMLASQQGSAVEGVLMLLAFSLGLGIPFIVSAVLIERLKHAFSVIKRHYRVINAVSGGLLIVVGILMMTGAFGYFLSLLTF